jgi:hypothetical protein
MAVVEVQENMLNTTPREVIQGEIVEAPRDIPLEQKFTQNMRDRGLYDAPQQNQVNSAQIYEAANQYEVAAQEAQNAANGFVVQTQRAGQEILTLQKQARNLEEQKIEGGKAVAGVALAGVGAKVGLDFLQEHFYNPETEAIIKVQDVAKIMKSGKTAQATAGAIIENAGQINDGFAQAVSGATAPIIEEAAREHSSKLLGEIAQSNLDLTRDVASSVNHAKNVYLEDGVQRFADEVGKHAGQGLQKLNPLNNPSKQLKETLNGLKDDIIEKSTEIASNNAVLPNPQFGVELDLKEMVRDAHKEAAAHVVETSKLSNKVLGNTKQLSEQILENVGGGDATKGLEELSGNVRETYKDNWFAEGANSVRDWAKAHPNQATLATIGIVTAAALTTAYVINEHNKNKDKQVEITQDQIEETKDARSEWASRVAPMREAAIESNAASQKLKQAASFQERLEMSGAEAVPYRG